VAGGLVPRSRPDLFNALLKPVGVEVYSFFNFLIHWISLSSLPLFTEFFAVGGGLGIARLDADRLGALDSTAERAFAGELKNVAEYACLLNLLATEEANDMFIHRVKSFKEFCSGRSFATGQFAHM
jgi:hypothetical protein